MKAIGPGSSSRKGYWGFFGIIARNQDQVLKQLFHISKDGTGNAQQVLSLGLGAKHGYFAITDKTGNELYELVYCMKENQGPAGWDQHDLAEWLLNYPALGQPFYRVAVVYDFPQSILTPASMFNPEDSQLFFGSLQGEGPGIHRVSELIPEWQLYNSYAVPDDIYSWVMQHFPSARSWHQYSLSIRKLNAAGPAGSLLVDCRTDDFTLLAARDSRLLLAQTFSYSTPADMVYYLLKTCRQFSLSQQEVNLQLSGLVDKNSSLYKELYQYFIRIEFREAAWQTGKDFPEHFFTTLNDLAQCAS